MVYALLATHYNRHRIVHLYMLNDSYNTWARFSASSTKSCLLLMKETFNGMFTITIIGKICLC